MNVGFLPRVGGSFRSLYEVARRLPPGSLEVLTSRHRNDRAFDRHQPLTIHRSWMLSLLDDEGVVYGARPIRQKRWVKMLIALRAFTVLGMLLLFVRTLAALCRRKYDFVIAGQAWVVGWPVWCASKLWRIRYGALVYGEDVGQIVNGGRRDLIAWLFLKSLAGAEWVVCNSGPTRRLAVAAGVDPRKLFVLCPGVDTALFRPRPSALKADNGGDARIVLSVGRVVPQKNFDAVVQALPCVRRAVPGIRYWIRGDGPEKSRIAALARRLGVNDCLAFIEECSYEELPNLYNACDLFVMPNRGVPESGEQEGFGMVFVEASACSKPVIGGRSGGAIEAVLDGGSGLLVDPGDVGALAAAMVRVLLDRELAARLGRCGREYVERAFSWDAYARQIRRLIGASVAGSGNRRYAPPPRSAIPPAAGERSSS